MTCWAGSRYQDGNEVGGFELQDLMTAILLLEAAISNIEE